VRLHEATHDPRFLDLAECALRRDLDLLVPAPGGGMQMNEGWRTMPYVATGSLGVGLLLREFLRQRDNAEFTELLGAIRIAAESEYVVNCGLFNGRAGLMSFLATVGGPRPRLESVVNRHVRRLAWHIVPYEGHIAFPGDQLLRLSTDLATGSAGVLFALSSVLDTRGLTLPFLTPGERG